MNDGAPGEVGDRLERLLPGDVDLDLGADRAHRGASLFSRARNCVQSAANTVQLRRSLDKSAIRSSQERKERAIFTNIRPTGIRSVETGAAPGAGTFFCTDCGAHLSLLEEDVLPECPSCGGSSFGRDSIFESMQDHGGQTAEFAAPHEAGSPDWLDEARAMLAAGRPRPRLPRATRARSSSSRSRRAGRRIGRSAAADLRLDDPSVSRRHALIVSERPKALRVLDDRSLNGVRLNGERIEWARLVDGDELDDRPLPAVRPRSLTRFRQAPDSADRSTPSISGDRKPSEAAKLARERLHEEIERVRDRRRGDARRAGGPQGHGQGLDAEELRRELDELRLETRSYVKRKVRKSEKRIERSVRELEARSDELERRIDQVEADREAAEWRIHNSTEEMLDGLLADVRAIADRLAGQPPPR